MNEGPLPARVPPIACSLAGSAMGDRFQIWRELARRALLGRERHPEGLVLRYRRGPGVEDELRRLVALEADCCAFLTFDLAPQERQLRLTVTGPAEAAPMIREGWGVP